MAQTLPKKTMAQTGKPQASVPEYKETNRDLVEQIVVALILAFLIRGFEAEAFVIPTGSMAPTLMGRHKEIDCPECGVTYPVNAADEVEGTGAGGRVVQGRCQNCRAPANTSKAPSFKGDRILVMKFLYDLGFLPGGGKPKRWDVVVFKYPEEPETNYIKRLVGLPGEDLRVFRGDIHTKPQGSDQPFRLERRPPNRQNAMQMLVWDDAHHPSSLKDKPDWKRWRSESPGSWSEENPAREGRPRAYVAGASAENWAELDYHHLAPDPMQWREILEARPLSSPPRPTLITDYYSYNTTVMNGPAGESFDWFQPHYVGDLTLSFRFRAGAPSGQLRVELYKTGVSNRCLIDLATGQATLYHGEEALGEARASGLDDTSEHRIMLANVDDRLTLWVDGRPIFGDGLPYDTGTQGGLDRAVPTAEDLRPARIAVKGPTATVSGLVLKRDIYYTLDPGYSDFSYYDPESSSATARPFDVLGANSREERVAMMFDVLADPRRFPELAQLSARDFAIRPGHYLMMGDNSPRSKDSRGWGTADQLRMHEETGWDPNLREFWEVPENLLVGKAFYIYWPHGKPFGPDIRIGTDFRIPFRPYFERMRWIR